MNINGTNIFSFLLMTAEDYLTALKVIRETVSWEHEYQWYKHI
nr:MAG TPA: hypothetical protein [Microviridae sp.]